MTRARAVGAANTLWFEDGELCSTNTDVEGFINNLDACAPGWDGAEDALVLGAGGASRAVVFGLLERGIKRVHLANRTLERARALADQFGAQRSAGCVGCDRRIAAACRAAGEYHVARHARPARARTRCRPAAVNAVVADLVYVPLQTPLLAAARARGLKTADGLGMLLHQAVRGFELWFGQRPEVTSELRALVEADLTNT